MIKRRTMLVVLGAGLLSAPLLSFAQQKDKVWRVGFLTARHIEFVDSDYYYGPFMQGLRDLGYVAGKNLVIEWRSAEGKTERLPGLAAELAQSRLDVIVAGGTPATIAAQKATVTIPIVMVGAGDPVRSGILKSLARPEGNITGLSNMSPEVNLKQLEMLLGMVPKLSRVAVLVNPSNPSNVRNLEEVRAAAQKRGLTILRAEAQDPQEIDNAFSRLRRRNAGALIVSLDSLFQQQKNQIAELAAKHRLPSMAGDPMYTTAGVLMSYGRTQGYQYRRAATYVDKIFKGANPRDLPVEQPTRFELFINGKTAKALGLKIPNSILVQATKIIE